MIEFHLPIPPSVNHCYVNNRFGGRMLTRLAKNWKLAASSLACCAKAKQGWVLSKKGKLVMEIRVFWPNARKRDADNLFKLLQDSLTGFLWADDNLVMPRVMGLDIDRDNPRLELKIYKLEQRQPQGNPS